MTTAADSFMRISTLDAHAAGEPLRIIVSGFPEPPGNTMLEKRDSALKLYDHLRRALMLEPRGHADMYGCLLTRPVTEDDFGVLFLHNEGYSTMCGHGIIAVVKAGLDAAVIAPGLSPHAIPTLIDVGTRIKQAVAEQAPPNHPTGEAELNFIYGTIFTWEQAASSGVHSRQVCIFADGELDRSPTGTGVSGRVAILHRRGQLALHQPLTIASVLDTTFEVSIVELTRVASLDAVIPEVSGTAFITGSA